MAEIPEVVRFHFARLAPSPWNWYTKSDYQGCALRWTAPEGNVALYIVFRSNENLPSDCCEDLLNGCYDDVAERIDIFKPITQLVDDEIHDKNRYLVLARLDNDDVVWVKDVESFQFTGAKPGESWTYWSNPYGDMPRMKDPCRLEYETVRVGTFCALEWDYPNQYPDFVGFDLIVCDVPYSPHTGADSDIAAFRDVLSGKLGTQYPLERFVNTVVDNESFVNRFGYYALLVKLPEGGRVQIPVRHISVPFEKGHPYQFLRARTSWGEGRDKMMAAYARWKAQVSAAAAQAQYQTPEPLSIVEESTSSISDVDIDFFRHSPDLSCDSFVQNPDMLGIQFTAKIADASYIVAVRSREELDRQTLGDLLEEAIEKGIVNGDLADAYAYCPDNGYMVLVDGDCHDKSNYAFAVYDPEDKQFAPLPHVKDATVDYFMVNPSASVLWGNSDFAFRNHLVNCIQCEEIDKISNIALELRYINDANIDAVELYVFDKSIEWNDETMRKFRDLQATGKSDLGQKYVFKGKQDGVLDDISPDGVHFYAATAVDFDGNRSPVQIYSQSARLRDEWKRVSDVAPRDAEKGDESPHVVSYGTQDVAFRDDDAFDDASSDSFGVSRGLRESGSRRRFSWDDDEPKNEAVEPVVEESVEESSERVDESVESEPERELGCRRRFSWDDDEPASEAVEPVAEGSVEESSERVDDSVEAEPERELGGRRRFSWDDDEPASEAVEPVAEGSVVESSERVDESVESEPERELGGRRRFSWDDDEPASEAVEPVAEGSVEESSERVDDSVEAEPERELGGRRRFSWDDDEPEQNSPDIEEAERLAREEAERLAREEAERLAREEAERLAREEAERLAREEAERLAREEAERLAREEAERLAREEAERLAREEAERLAREEEERLVREEAERLAREEAERLAREEAERLAREEAERLAREEAERLAREEAERLAREEAERLAREEAERLAREEAERLAREEAERLAREEAERLAREEAERLAREEAERLAREEAERLAREEAERLAREEAERLAREEAERLAREEAERQAREEAERRKKEDEDIVKLLATCRQYLNDGDMQEAYEVIQRAKKTYRDNLRIEAFEWNYLRM